MQPNVQPPETGVDDMSSPGLDDSGEMDLEDIASL